MTNFLHGINVTEINEGISTVRTSSSSVIGVIGTAPDANTADFPLNTPVSKTRKFGDTSGCIERNFSSNKRSCSCCKNC